MKKLYPIENCTICDTWDYKNSKDYCKKKNKIIPDRARKFPKWCPLENEKRFAFFRRLFR